MSAHITGWGHTPFGKHAGRDAESLLVEATQQALAHAQVAAEDVDAVVLSWFNEGFADQGSGSSLVMQADPGLRFKPAVRVENACASGTAAVHLGATLLAAGEARRVLVVGVEKMTDRSGKDIGRILQRASYVREEGDIEGGFAGLFGVIAQRYFDRHGSQLDALARIAAKNHANGVHNPLAQLRRDLGYAFCREASENNPPVAGPLKRTDCSLVSDGAAALVLQTGADARNAPQAVEVVARAQVNDYLPMARRDVLAMEAASRAWQQALGQAGASLDDLSLVETHDCFTIAELLEYEAMGLTPPGQGARALDEGWTLPGGRLPVNLSGGLKSKGHPIGATGVSMHVMAAMQLTGQAGAMQHPNASQAGVFNMGGAAVSNYVSILRATR